jgi:hypothetical protein
MSEAFFVNEMDEALRMFASVFFARFDSGNSVRH